MRLASASIKATGGCSVGGNGCSLNCWAWPEITLIGVRSSWATPSTKKRSCSQALARRDCNALKASAIGCNSVGWRLNHDLNA